MSPQELSAIAVRPETLPLIEQYAAVRRTTESICEGLSIEDQMVQSMSDASPTKWHLAHTSWFFETFILQPHLEGYKLFHDDFTFLFNSYYKQLGSHPNRSYRGFFSRPSNEQVQEYRRHVDRHMLKFLGDSNDSGLGTLTTIGLNHEQQHQELIITDAKHALWSNPLRPAWKGDVNGGRSPSSDSAWLDFDENLYSIGHGGDGFSFDNETPRHQVFVNRFSISSLLVTNRDYLEFIRDGGYTRPELWLSDGWDTVNTQGWTMPLYWQTPENVGTGVPPRQTLEGVGTGVPPVQRDAESVALVPHVFTVNGLQPLNLDEPVCHISYYEADAFARWSGARLPTEAEWEIAASHETIDGNFLESGSFHPRASSDHQFFGDVWEWTSSPYTAYPGFHPEEGALGEYNGKFMCNQFVLRGGSCATPQSHIRATYRNFFPPHARWQFMGLRLAK